MDRTEPRQASAGGDDHSPATVGPDPPPRPPRTGVVRVATGTGALVTVLLTLAFPPVASGAPATAASLGRGAGDNVALVRQSAWVGPAAPGHALVLGLRVKSSAPRQDLRVGVTVYRHLTTRSAFDETLSGRGLGGVLDHSPPLALSSLVTDAQGVTRLTIGVHGDTAVVGAADWTADLGCEPGSCADVYPVRVTLTDTRTSGSSSGSAAASLVTYLVYDDPAPTSQPIRLALVAPLGLAPPVADASGTVPVPGRRAVGGLEGLASTVAAAGSVPVTVAPDPATLAALRASGDTRALALVGQASAGPTHETLAQSYVPVDATGLVDAGLGGELDAQWRRGADVLASAPAEGHATRDSWVSASPLDQATLDQLEPQFGRVVVPGDTVSGPSGPLTVTQPFRLTSGKGAAPLAAVSDDGLDAQLAAGHGRDPVLAAEQLLAEVALVYYEAPNLQGPTGAGAPRGLVAVAPAGWAPDPAFVSTVLAGLQGNPVITPVTLDQLFTQVPVGADRQANTRRPVTGSTRPVPQRALRDARGHVADFASAVGGNGAGDAEVERLEDLLLAAESSSLSARAQDRAIAGVRAALAHQLGLVSVRSDTIRLTAGTASVPITVVRNTTYPVTVQLRLTSDKLRFPGAGAQVPGALCQAPQVQSTAGRSSFSAQCVLDHTTNAVYIDMRARASGDFRIDVTLSSPHGDLVMAAGHLTVRSMSTSAVAIGLSAGAAVVLLVWWGRTLWRGKRGRHAARARRATRRGQGRDADTVTPDAGAQPVGAGSGDAGP